MSKLIYFRVIDGVKAVRVYEQEDGLYGTLIHSVDKAGRQRKSSRNNLRKNPCPDMTMHLAALSLEHSKTVINRLEVGF